jgi:hypothetical protein
MVKDIFLYLNMHYKKGIPSRRWTSEREGAAKEATGIFRGDISVMKYNNEVPLPG